MEKNQEQLKAPEKKQKDTEKKQEASPKKEEKDSNFLQPDLRRLKKAWEKVQHHQTYYPRFRRKARISSVKIVKNEKGNKSIEVQMSDGGKFNDVGDKRDLFIAMASKKKPSLQQLMALVEAVRAMGFDAVAMGLPPELKKMLMRACKQCNVPLKPKEVKKVRLSSSHSSEKKSSSSFSSSSSPLSPNYWDYVKPNPYRLPLPDYPITSVASLDQAVEEQKRLNKEYLENRLKRCQDEIKDEFFDQYRRQLKDIEKAIAEGKPLNKNQQMIKQFADMYGLKADKSQEKPNKEQAKAREKLGIKDLPKEFQEEYKKRETHYKGIYESKNMALEVVRNEMQTNYFKNGAAINMSQMDLAKAAVLHMPKPEDRNAQTMAETKKKLKDSLAKSSSELKRTKEAHRTRTKAVLFKKDPSEKEAPTPKKKRKSPNDLMRKSYMANASAKAANARRLADLRYSR
ncbi:MAG: hypothetical protein J5716_00120 [Alphaproteobacteria bacterium]|nr:hypothetical protein [Alphaproteobacteria bacterium]